MAKDLLILGNGFDLSIGLKSSFSDYLKSKESEISQAVKELKIYSPALLFKQAWRVEDILKNNSTNIWEVICYLKNNNTNWADVESNINSTIDYIFQNNTDRVKGSDYDNLLNKLRIKFGDELLFFLYGELENFEFIFREYLISQKDENYLEGAKRKLMHISKNNNVDVLSFNYTLSNQDDYIKTLNIEKWINIHGYLGAISNGEWNYVNILPIIGIDSANIKDISDPKYLFTKTYRTLLRKTTSQQKLPDAVNSIIFYGHSLSFSDYSYFESLFDMYDLYNSNLILKFYYGTFNLYNLPTNSTERLQLAQKNLEIQQNSVDQIMHLIMHYGATLHDNHGNNLYSKLILEGRLILEEDIGSRG